MVPISFLSKENIIHTQCAFYITLEDVLEEEHFGLAMRPDMKTSALSECSHAFIWLVPLIC